MSRVDIKEGQFQRGFSAEKVLDPPLLPFLRWPGGKRWLSGVLREIASQVPYSRYVEPFLGGGSTFFALNPGRALLSDVNANLIQVYRAVRESPDEVERALERIPLGESAYYTVRGKAPRTDVNRAAQFIYLNRTSFSGIYRVNALGRFNVPYGGDRIPSDLIARKILTRASTRLSTATLCVCDFGQTIKMCGRGDFVYCDPTYTVSHNNNGFIRYNESNFAWSDQARLRGYATSAARRGASVLISNAHHRQILKLYRGFPYAIVRRYSALCPNTSHRGQRSEVLIWVSRDLPPPASGCTWKYYSGSERLHQL